MNWDSIACGTTLHHPVKAITFQVRKREPNIQALFDLVCSRFDATWAPVSLLWEKAAFKPKFLCNAVIQPPSIVSPWTS
jgi:hypothetical protein